MSKLRVQCCTYNGHLGLGTDPSQPDLTSWLIPTLAEGSNQFPPNGEAGAGDPPDIVAVGFQEMIPLHFSLLGLTRTALDIHDAKLKDAIEAHAMVTRGPKTDSTPRERYTLVAKKALAGIALLVYTRDSTTTDNVVDVRVATAACGLLGRMGNKGAVGVRITLDDGEEREKDESEDTVLTFVTAHLAAHDTGLERRNEDWKSIVQRLVFSRDGFSEHYWPGRAKDVFAKVPLETTLEAGGLQIYDTSALFFFGDLNYRISTKYPSALTLESLSSLLQTDLPALLARDQLSHQQALGKTLHNLREGSIDFKPTYKFKLGTLDQYASFSKRVPGWCDRVLFATWADGNLGGNLGGETEALAKVELYRSVMGFTKSDHKPVSSGTA